MDEPDLTAPAPIKKGRPTRADLIKSGRRILEWSKTQPRWALIAPPPALLVGVLMGILVIPDADPRTTEEYIALRERTSEEIASLRDRTGERQDQIGDLTRDLRKYQNREDDLVRAAEDATRKEEELATKEASLAAREEAVGAAEAAKRANQFGDGVHLVGTDIQPGTYRNDGQSGCYWARRSGVSGDSGEILANDIVNGPTVVAIAASDAAFQSSRCGTWTKIG